MGKDLDQVIHQPARTKIVAHLVNFGACDYTSLKNTLGLSDGHMSTHMRQLVESGYVDVEKAFVDNKPKTTYKITKEGRKKFSEYIMALKKLISF
jgi:predicted ArsR family transcriptional regulator